MRQVFGKGGIIASRLFRCLFAVVLGLLVISQAVRAQSKDAPASSACVPSDLNALIVPEGGTVHVDEVREFGRQRSVADKTLLSGAASGSLDAREMKTAYKIFLKEARQGNPAAMANLAVCFLAGWGAQPNAGTALYWLRAATDRGLAPASYDLGILYFKGCGVREDLAEAFHFFRLGADSGYAPAQVNLGYFYDHGLGVAQDHAAAAAWYRRAAEAGEAQAQYNLGDLYLHGEGVPRDESIAFNWFKKAALQGHSGGRIMVGSMLAVGRGTSKDLAVAYFWIFAAVLQGDDRGASTLRALERQLSVAEIEEAKERGRLLVAGVEAAKNR